MTNKGTLTATTPDGAFEAECLLVAEDQGVVSVTAVGSTSVLEGVQPRTLTLSVRGETPGTYPYGGFPATLSAFYSPTPADDGTWTVYSAGEGSAVVLDEASPRLAGSFELRDEEGRPEVADGWVVSGRFDVAR